MFLLIFSLPVGKFCIFLFLHVFAGVEKVKKPNETAKKTRRNGEKIKNPKCEDWNGKKNWKLRYFRQPATIIVESDFEW